MAKQPPSHQLAEAVLEVAQLVTRLVAPAVRRQQPRQLSLSHMRALGFLDTNPDATLSDVADYVGLRLPSTSTLVDGLARRGLVARLAAAGDRRRLRLRVTAAGQAALRTARTAAQAALDVQLAGLPASARARISRALALLRPLLTRSPGASPRRR
jgi:DNA-binding MarR family transcriptional regulator